MPGRRASCAQSPGSCAPKAVESLGAQTWFDSDAKVDLRPEERSVGLVFQEYALFPHMTVAQNVAFAGAGRLDELLELLGISSLRDARPGQLSGGERQRVALARALARDPPSSWTSPSRRSMPTRAHACAWS